MVGVNWMNSGFHGSCGRLRATLPPLRALALLVPLLAVSALVFAATASAQDPDICEQYPNLPQCTEPDDDGGDDDQAGAGAGGGGGGVPGANAGLGGELPFTGYPLSPLLLACLALLAAGVALRTGMAIQERRGQAASVGSDPPASV